MRSPDDMSQFFNWKILLPVATMVLIVAAVVSFRSGDAESERHEQKVFRSRTPQEKARDRALRERKRLIRIEQQKQAAKNRPAPTKPNLSSDDEEMAKLTGEMKRIFQELREALDSDNKKRTFALVHRLQSMKEWPDGIPQSVKLKALQALRWFGADGIAEAVGFLADSDPTVVQEALSDFSDQLFDADGDLAKARIIKSMLPVASGEDMIDTIIFEMDNLRPTLRAELTLEMVDGGNEELVKAVEDNLDFIFGDAEEDVTSREDIERYWDEAQKAYDEDPQKAQDDEEFYGPSPFK